jgi:hypothetical protein
VFRGKGPGGGNARPRALMMFVSATRPAITRTFPFCAPAARDLGAWPAIRRLTCRHLNSYAVSIPDHPVEGSDALLAAPWGGAGRMDEPREVDVKANLRLNANAITGSDAGTAGRPILPPCSSNRSSRSPTEVPNAVVSSLSIAQRIDASMSVTWSQFDTVNSRVSRRPNKSTASMMSWSTGFIGSSSSGFQISNRGAGESA